MKRLRLIKASIHSVAYLFFSSRTASLTFTISVIVTMISFPAFTHAQEIQLEIEAWEENPDSGYVSCPWIHCWNGLDYIADNDVYSTARGASREYADFYTLQKALVEEDGMYLLELRENGAEHSFTDMVKLLVVDHPSSVRIGSDETGNIGTYALPLHPISVVSNESLNVLEEVIEEDSSGVSVYHKDFLEVDFGDVDVSQGALLVLRAIGFQLEQNQDPGDKTYAQPAMQIQTLNSQGEWVTRNTFHPRDDWATGCYDLSGLLADGDGNLKVRILVTSCHSNKYHSIDYIGLDTDPQVPVITNALLPARAVHSKGTNVLSHLAASDGIYAETMTGQKISMAFPVPAMTEEKRDFVFVSEGYYVPLSSGTYYISTWNTSIWKTVYSEEFFSFVNADTSHFFDMEPYLPDTDGDYKVRISQSHRRSPAGIDFVGLTKDGEAGTMVSAWDIGKAWSVLDTISVSDNIWNQFGDWPYDTSNIRTVEIEWKWGAVDIIEHQLRDPKEYQLLQNYPNPFKLVTTINYRLPITCEVELGVYNLLGQKMITLVSQRQPEGIHMIEWNAGDLPGGMYIYRMKAGNFVATGRMVLQR